MGPCWHSAVELKIPRRLDVSVQSINVMGLNKREADSFTNIALLGSRVSVPRRDVYEPV